METFNPHPLAKRVITRRHALFVQIAKLLCIDVALEKYFRDFIQGIHKRLGMPLGGRLKVTVSYTYWDENLFVLRTLEASEELEIKPSIYASPKQLTHDTTQADTHASM